MLTINREVKMGCGCRKAVKKAQPAEAQVASAVVQKGPALWTGEPAKPEPEPAK